jgi:hypothetical protein
LSWQIIFTIEGIGKNKKYVDN